MKIKRTKMFHLALLAGGIFVNQSHAASATGTASFELITPITVAEATQMQIGYIDAVNDGSCTLDTSDSTTGTSCVAGITPVTGVFDITAESDSTLNLAVSTTDATTVSGVTFTPQIDSSSVTLTGTSGQVRVGATLDIIGADASDGSHNLNYTLEVTY
jgi:hypothetical protein